MVSDIQEKVKVLPEAGLMLKAMVTNQTAMTEAAKSMAKTFERAEIRQAQLELNNTKLYEHKGVSDRVFAMVVGTLLLVMIALIIWGTGLNLKGSLTNLEISQQQNIKELQSSVKTSTNEILEEVQKEGVRK